MVNRIDWQAQRLHETDVAKGIEWADDPALGYLMCSSPDIVTSFEVGGIGGFVSLEDAPLLMRIGALSEELQEIKGLLLERRGDLHTEVTAIDATDLRLLSPIPVCIRESADGYFTATFFDAGLVGSGPTEIEAFNMLRDTIVSSFRLFVGNEEKLGRRPQQQLAILRQFLLKAE